MAGRHGRVERRERLRAARQAGRKEREQAALDPRPWDGHTPPAVVKPDTRALSDTDLHRRIGPAVPPDEEDDWYR